MPPVVKSHLHCRSIKPIRWARHRPCDNLLASVTTNLLPNQMTALNTGIRAATVHRRPAQLHRVPVSAAVFPNPPPAEQFEIVQTGANEIAITSFGGEPFHVVRPNMTRAYWKTLTQVDVERIDASTQLRVPDRIIDRLSNFQKTLFHGVLVEAHEVCLLFVNGALHEKLNPGRYAF